MTVALWLVVIHFVADFVFQSDWMAANKSKRWDALAVHVGTYTCVLGAFTYALADDALAWLVFVLVNGVLHFATDAVTSRINSRFWFFQREDGIWAQAEYTMPKHGRTLVNPWTPIDGKRHWFFVGIGADQVLHYAALFLTAERWLR